MKQSKLSLLKDKVVRGMFSLIVRDFILKIISIFGQIILVKIIAPQYFGFFAIIVFLVNVFELFSDLGFSQAIVQNKKKLTNVQLSTIFFLKLSLSVISIILLVISFPAIKFFYQQLTYVHFTMLIFLSSTIIIKTTKGILFALLDKDLNFSVVSKIDIAGIIIYFVVAITFALNGMNLWSLIYAIFAKELIELFIAFYYKPWKPQLVFNFKSVKKMIKYGSFLQIGNFIAFIETSIIPIAGFRLSAHQLGLLQWSSNVSSLSDTLFENYGRAAFAGLSRIQEKKDKITLAVNKSTSLLNSFIFLFALLIFGYAHEFTFLILSKQWLASLPSLYWFVSSLIFFGGSITLAHALLAIGKSKEVTILTGITVLLELLIALFLLQKVGFNGIAVAVFITYCIQFLGYYFLGKNFGLNLSLKKSLFTKLLVFAFSGIGVIFLNTLFHNFFITTFFLKVAATCALYIIFISIISKEDVREILKIFHIIKN